jgi:hypothetical protein
LPVGNGHAAAGFSGLAAGAAAFGAGFVNAVAGGGSLVSFPALLALGVPPVAASVWLYVTPTVPPGSVVVVMTRFAGLTTIESA